MVLDKIREEEEKPNLEEKDLGGTKLLRIRTGVNENHD